ncbi:MAG: CBS domain-containing protein [Propionibacteriaceae bacterium]|mgnify:FL=1|jgi:CBS domain-containing protein|nr:CBS domain-containing protein [Propionibacteriaceae bacterium]
MKIEDVVRQKGTDVVTIDPAATVKRLIDLLAEYNIGAVVVSTDGRHIDGIVSERDVVRHLATEGAGVLDTPVSAIMTAQVKTCSPSDPIEETAHTMTYARIRHLPVVVEGELKAVVSIGDVVKYRIDQLTDERNHLLGYLHT